MPKVAAKTSTHVIFSIDKALHIHDLERNKYGVVKGPTIRGDLSGDLSQITLHRAVQKYVGMVTKWRDAGVKGKTHDYIENQRAHWEEFLSLPRRYFFDIAMESIPSRKTVVDNASGLLFTHMIDGQIMFFIYSSHNLYLYESGLYFCALNDGLSSVNKHDKVSLCRARIDREIARHGRKGREAFIDKMLSREKNVNPIDEIRVKIKVRR